jgi:hypothetical protein
MRKIAGVSLLIVASLVVSAREARAQGFGIGPRMSMVRGDVPSGTPSARFFGGTIRMQSSKRVVLEVAADLKTQTSADGVLRERQRPIQGSILLFLARTTFAPYVLGGYGLYDRKVEVLDAVGNVVSEVSNKETGAHMGFGAELFISRHAALFADYRYRFVRFGEPEEGGDPIDIPFIDQAKLSHRGTMWTSGVAFYF